jgi:SAM-dependent methyltransferase
VRPVDIPINEQFEFVARALDGCHRVLEVGCGSGMLAHRLAAAGFAVTALDRREHDEWSGSEVEFVAQDFFAFDDDPYDAVVFTASLHHLAPVGVALDRAAKLLARGGIVAVDDFDLAAADHAILAWYYGLQESLAASGQFPRDHIDPPGGDLLARWRDAHAETPPLAFGHEMIAEIEMRFAIRELGRGPYLYRYLCHHLDDARVAAQIFETERAKIEVGAFAPVGLRIVAEHR